MDNYEETIFKEKDIYVLYSEEIGLLMMYLHAEKFIQRFPWATL